MKLKIFLSSLVVVVVVVDTYLYFSHKSHSEIPDSLPHNVTLSGTYVCLPLLDVSVPVPAECTFGLKTDDGIYYMVNFGQSASAMEAFQKGADITVDGFYMYKESLSTNQWAKFNMKGIFTVTSFHK